MRIVIVLLAAGPLFVLEIPASPFIFPFFGLHTLQYHKKLGIDICTADVMMLGTGSVLNIFSVLVIYPAYICFTVQVAEKLRVFSKGYSLVPHSASWE